jgi:hypothetical protein
MTPLVLWNGILIDGHNRYEICKKHKIRFTTVDKEFASRDEVLIWIISTQIARRNLTAIQLSYYRGVHYNADKRVQGTANQYSEQSEKGHNDPFHFATAERLAKQYNISPKTIKRDAQVAAAIDAIGENSPEAKREILSGTADISRKYLRELISGPEETIKETAASIAEGTFERRKTASETDLSAQDVLEAFNSAIFKMTSEFNSAIQRLKSEIGADELKTTIRKQIDALEQIYNQI